jgi:hypothetical protein
LPQLMLMTVNVAPFPRWFGVAFASNTLMLQEVLVTFYPHTDLISPSTRGQMEPTKTRDLPSVADVSRHQSAEQQPVDGAVSVLPPSASLAPLGLQYCSRTKLLLSLHSIISHGHDSHTTVAAPLHRSFVTNRTHTADIGASSICYHCQLCASGNCARLCSAWMYSLQSSCPLSRLCNIAVSCAFSLLTCCGTNLQRSRAMS